MKLFAVTALTYAILLATYFAASAVAGIPMDRLVLYGTLWSVSGLLVREVRAERKRK